jgi:glutaredoxin
MRVCAAVAVAIALLGPVLSGCDRSSGPAAPSASSAAPAPAPPASPAPAPAARADSGDVEPMPGERTYWSVVAEDGSVQFYDELDRVPEALRAKAKPISMGSASSSDADDPLSRAEAASSAAWGATGSQSAPAPPAARLPDDGAAPAEAGVVVYTTSWCPWCRKTLAWLDEQGVAYVNKDIERNLEWRRELIEKTGQAAIPVVEMRGQIVRGFDPERMEQLL